MRPQPVFTPLRRIPTPKGEVRHGLKASDPEFAGFGEAYFTEILSGEIKGWKRHNLMTMNLVVVVGTVRFILRDNHGEAASYTLSADAEGPYGRLTVPPGLWMAFEGVSAKSSLLMNLASHEHNPTEADNRELDAFSATLTPDGTPPR